MNNLVRRILTLALGVCGWAATAAAADLGEVQLVAVNVQTLSTTIPTSGFTNIADYVRCEVTNGGVQECYSVASGVKLDQVNCLVGVGASMRQYDDDGDGRIDPGDPFDPLTFAYFGRTTCNRPFPNANDQTLPNGTQVRFVVGAGVPIRLNGRARLFRVFDSSSLIQRTFLGEAGNYDEVGSDNWGLSRGYFTRPVNSPNLADTYVVNHTTYAELPDGWVWVQAPPICTGSSTRIAICNQDSVPFQIGPNPGEPAGAP